MMNKNIYEKITPDLLQDITGRFILEEFLDINNEIKKTKKFSINSIEKYKNIKEFKAKLKNRDKNTDKKFSKIFKNLHINSFICSIK